MNNIFTYSTIGPVATNCYVIGDRKEAIMIDPGGIEAIHLARELKNKGVEIKHILVTHGHFDHLGWSTEVQKEFKNNEVYLHRDEKLVFKEFHNWMMKYGIEQPHLKEPDNWLGDNQILNISGLKIKIIHTPGHTPGSSVFYIQNYSIEGNSSNIAFVGDLLFRGSIGRVDFPHCNKNDMEKSLKRIMKELPLDTIILSGHGESTDMKTETNNNSYLLALQKGIPIF